MEWLRGSAPPGVWVAPPGVDGLRFEYQVVGRVATPDPRAPAPSRPAVGRRVSSGCRVRVDTPFATTGDRLVVRGVPTRVP